MVTSSICSHLIQVSSLPEPTTRECAECIAFGDSWVHLRMCLECGHVGCCDSSQNRHATLHNQSVGHPLARGIEPGERWVWCYIDQQAIDV